MQGFVDPTDPTAVAGVGPAAGITSTPVIEYLQVQVGQSRDALTPPLSYGNGDYYNAGGNTASTANLESPYYPRWSIEQIQVDKVNYATKPSINMIDEVGNIYTVSKEVKAVNPVPPEHVPAWTEIEHLGINGWTRQGTGESFPHLVTGSYNGGNAFGNNYLAVVQTGLAQNNSFAGNNWLGDPLYNTDQDGPVIE